MRYSLRCLFALAIVPALCRGVNAQPLTAENTSATTRPLHAPGGSARAMHPAGGHTPLGVAPLKLKLPFPAGHSYKVIQGNHGDYTHTGFNEYAWDFALPLETPVCAAAGGRVVRVKQDGTSGGPSSEFFSQGNAIILDHGSGYFSQYLHLAPRSAKVREGELVAAGQVIALSGNTGFSSTPHLHFHVQDSTGRSLPVKFADVPGEGKPAEGTSVTSANDGTGTSQYAGESHLPPDIFQANSIELLTRNLPGHLYRSSREYPLRGRLNSDAYKKVAIYFMSTSGGQALHTVYADVTPDGFFEANLNPAALKHKVRKWTDDTTQSNSFSLAVAPVNADGSFWSDVSVPICVR